MFFSCDICEDETDEADDICEDETDEADEADEDEDPCWPPLPRRQRRDLGTTLARLAESQEARAPDLGGKRRTRAVTGLTRGQGIRGPLAPGIPPSPLVPHGGKSKGARRGAGALGGVRGGRLREGRAQHTIFRSVRIAETRHTCTCRPQIDTDVTAAGGKGDSPLRSRHPALL